MLGSNFLVWMEFVMYISMMQDMSLDAAYEEVTFTMNSY